MPIIKIHVATPTADAQALATLRDAVTGACLELLRAAPDAVQIAVIPGTLMLVGQPAYVEVFYRHQPHRDGPAMAAFMAVLSEQTRAAFGCVPRIRCMAIDQSLLHARD
jgi:hypothetical protein